MENLENLVGKSFKKTRFGATTTVILEDIKKKDVKLREEGRKDSYFLPIEKFKKFYKPV